MQARLEEDFWMFLRIAGIGWLWEGRYWSFLYSAEPRSRSEKSAADAKELSRNNFSYCLSFSPIVPLKNQLHSPLCAWFLSGTLEEKSCALLKSYFLTVPKLNKTSLSTGGFLRVPYEYRNDQCLRYRQAMRLCLHIWYSWIIRNYTLKFEIKMWYLNLNIW